MCLTFITYYPKIDLAGCYSMTPVIEFFEAFGVYKFDSLNMTDVENLFLYNGYVFKYKFIIFKPHDIWLIESPDALPSFFFC